MSEPISEVCLAEAREAAARMAGWRWEAVPAPEMPSCSSFFAVRAGGERIVLVQNYPFQTQHAHHAALAENLLPLLLAAVEERDGLLWRMTDSEAYQLGQETERRAVLDVIHTLNPGSGVAMADLEFHVTRERGVIREPLPPEQARRELDRLRAAVRKLAEMFTPLDEPTRAGLIARIGETEKFVRQLAETVR